MSVELRELKYKGDDPKISYINEGYKTDSQNASQDSLPPYSNTGYVDDEPPSAYSISNGQGATESSTDEQPNAFVKQVIRIQDGITSWFEAHKGELKWVFFIILLLLYTAYFCYAMYYEQLVGEDAIRLLWVTCLVVFCSVLYLFCNFCGPKLSRAAKPLTDKLSKDSVLISWVVVTILMVAVILFIIFDISLNTKQPYNLVSGAGIIIYVILFYVFSYDPSKVRWRPVVWGLALQFLMALVILRWSWGRIAFDWLGKRVEAFLLHTDAGSIFVFGEAFTNHFFAFKILPVVIFFSCFISVMYYLGVMQFVIRHIATVMQVTMGTTAGESMNAAGNIFIGQSEAPLLIRPLIHQMTRSELHAVMTGGFATIAGTVLAAYISYGVPSNHLLSASVMSAPAALAMAKLFYPEVEESKTKADDVKTMESPQEQNIVEAASAGASNAIVLVANIAANLIAFIAMLHFVNGVLMWFGERVGVEGFTFEFICSYALWPFALIMGVEVVDCRKVAQLIGIKTFLNEFVAYEALSVYIFNKETLISYNATFGHNDTYTVLQNGTIYLNGTNQWLEDGILSERSEVISTYALCGFANIGSIGIMLGALGAMAPERKPELASIAIRAMIAGNVACFMTACIAGLLYQTDDPFVL